MELPADECEVKQPSSNNRNFRVLKICPPKTLPSRSESLQNTPTKVQELESENTASPAIWAPTPTTPGNPIGSAIGSISISDITENDEHEPASATAPFVQYYDSPVREQRSAEGSLKEDKSC